MGRGGGGGGGGGGRGGGTRGGHGGGGWGRGGGGRGGRGYGSGGARGRGRGSGRVAGSGSKNGRMKHVGRGVEGMKNSGNRGINRETRKESSDLINRLNDIRQKFGNISGPHGESRRAFQGRSKSGRGGGGRDVDASDLLMVGIEEICARIADGAIAAAISTAYGMCVNEGQLAIIDDAVPSIEACWGAIFEGASAEVSFPHPEAVGEIEGAVNEILSSAADQCAELRLLAEDWEHAIEDNNGKGGFEYDWYGYE